MIRSLLGPLLLSAAAPALAAPEYGGQSRDHDAILKMAGSYQVTFDMRETVALAAGYTLYPPKVSKGHEVVRAIVDEPGRIVLQHLLVVETEQGKPPTVIKHWRQDWAWQPADLLVYADKGRWTLKPVAAADRRGAWSQTVWQTDDSPRYGGIGRWRYDDGVARWQSDETLRPLARRDATRRPPYDHYLGVNRHALTPAGWVHEQDNAKVGAKDGRPVTFAHEIVLNSYTPATDFPVKAADDYWDKTKGYWTVVRDEWSRVITTDGGVNLGEEADNGSATGHELMLLADDIVTGEQSADQAIDEARTIIRRDRRQTASVAPR